MQNRTAKHSTVCHYGVLCVSLSNSHSLFLHGGFHFGNCLDIKFLLQNGCQVTSSLSLQPIYDSLCSEVASMLIHYGWAFLEERQSLKMMCVSMRVHLHLINHLLIITLKQTHRKKKNLKYVTN